MPLLNYTTTVEAAKTVSQIQAILQAHGAKSILINYATQGQVESLFFIVNTPSGDLSFKLPVNPEAVFKVMERARQTGRTRKRIDRPQAVRIAWRILKDWVEAQMAIIETEMVRLEQVFLPYAQMQNGQTLFENFEQRGFLQLKEGKGEKAA